MKWYESFPEFASLWSTFERLDMDELERLRKQLGDAHQQIEQLQQLVEELRLQLQMSQDLRIDRPQGFNTAHFGE